MRIELPHPPSANRYWRHPTKGQLAGRHLISEEGRKYRTTTGWLLAGKEKFDASKRLKVTIEWHPPDNRRRDIDNIQKPLLDAITHARIWHDDSQIDDLRTVRMPVQKGGKVVVKIEVLE